MKAFVEILSGVVRSGPTTDRYGQPFEFAVAFSSVDGKTAVAKALVADELRFTRAHFRSAIIAMEALGLTVEWERFKEMPRPTAWQRFFGILWPFGGGATSKKPDAPTK